MLLAKEEAACSPRVASRTTAKREPEVREVWDRDETNVPVQL